MECPKCQSEFASVSFGGIEVERCQGCQGLWFDAMEKEDLLKIRGSEAIDIGEGQVEEAYRDLRNIDCPKCHLAMIPMVDKDQFHIRYECCPYCYGTYFDAGEFRDLKEFSVVERFQQMLETLRSNL